MATFIKETSAKMYERAEALALKYDIEKKRIAKFYRIKS